MSYIRGVPYSTGVFFIALDFCISHTALFFVSYTIKFARRCRSHSRVFTLTPPSPARGAPGAQFCYPLGARLDLAAGRGVVPRSRVSILRLITGNYCKPTGPTDRLLTGLVQIHYTTEPGHSRGIGCLVYDRARTLTLTARAQHPAAGAQSGAKLSRVGFGPLAPPAHTAGA
jgi:hypothetical protein